MTVINNKEKSSVIVCPLCNKINEISSSKCNFCEADFNAMTVCPQCFYEQSVKNNFCKKCQQSLKKNVQFYSKKPSQTYFISKNESGGLFRLFILISLPLICFIILVKNPSLKIQFPVLLLMIVSIFMLLKRPYRR
jgi:hypothetical protein